MVKTKLAERYECEICKKLFSSKQDAIGCEATGLDPFHETGSTVNVMTVVFDEGTDSERGVPVPATIVRAFHGGHVAQYELDREILINQYLRVGKYNDKKGFHAFCANFHLHSSTP